MVFKGKRKQGCTLSLRKNYRRKKRKLPYSPRPSPCKRFKNIMGSPHMKAGYNKLLQKLTPGKHSHREKESPFKDEHLVSYSPSPVRFTKRRLNTVPEKKSAENLLTELECSILPIDDEDVDEQTATVSVNMPQEILNNLTKDTDPVGDTTEAQKCLQATLSDMLPHVIKELEKHNKVDILENFFRLVKEKRFPLNNISFLLWCDVLKWFENSDTRGMRYSPECLQFFWVGRKLFGGRFLRFMSGVKNEGDLITGDGKALSSETSRINFACPSLNVLLNVNPLGDELPATFKPGVMTEMIKYKAENDRSDNSYVLMLDGKKMKRSADVDLLDCETGDTVSLKKRIAERDRKIEVLNDGISKVKDAQAETNLVSETPTNTKVVIYTVLLGILMLFSTVLKELRPLKLKKMYAMNKLKELGGIEWRKSKYAYAIDLYMTTVWKIDNCIDKCMQILKTICKTAAHLNKVGHLFAEDNIVDLRSQGNLKILKPVERLPGDISSLDTSVIKQRSEKWFADRQKMKVTGSTLYQAIGCDSLKRQKEHFDRVVHDIQPQETSEAQQSAMKHGTETEIHHIATMCGIVLPFLYPDLSFYEEGYYIKDNVLISPDGSLRSSDEKPVYAFEGKSPIPKSHVSSLHYNVPVRYITQTMYEGRATDTNGTLYLCWTDESCTLFKVPRNEELCREIDKEIEDVYFVENPKRPVRVSHNAKRLKDELSKHSDECIFLGEFPSVKGTLGSISQGQNTDTSSVYETQNTGEKSDFVLTYDDLLRHLLLGREVLADSYELQRTMASQVVVYLLADLDRFWKEEKPHAIPVLYFYRGYSLNMETTRQINEKCKEACRSHGLDVIVTAADGEFSPIIVRGKNNQPLTQHQLSKDIWKEVSKYTKKQIITTFLDMCKPDNAKTVETSNKIILVSQTAGRNMEKIKTPKKGWTCANSKKNETAGDTLIEHDEVPRFEDVENSEDVTASSHEQSEPVDETEEASHLQEINIDTSDICRALKMLNPEKWSDINSESISQYLRCADKLKKLNVKELTEIAKCINKHQKDRKKHVKVSNVKKHEIVNHLSKIVGDGTQTEAKTRPGKRNVQPLKQLAQRVIMKKTFPKKVLNIALANFKWPERLKNWKESACVGQIVEVHCVSENLHPYYVPDRNENGEFEVFVYDKTHLGSNLRKAICLNKVHGVSKSAWERVADKYPDKLNPLLLDVSEEGKIMDQMKERFARNMVSTEVETYMIENGDIAKARFCEIIREGLYEADDTPGISATMRCEKRLELVNWLDTGVDFGDFPPYGATIKGMSSILYEGLRTSSEAKLYLYALSKQGTYCVRAPNTLCSESFFSTMQEMDPWGQGVLTADGIEKHISDFTAITAMKMREDRSFYISTKRDKVYPVPTVSSTNGTNVLVDDVPSCRCREKKFIRCIVPKDHFFDSKERSRGKRQQKKAYQFADINEPQRGDQPVRSRYGYKLNETKLLTSKRIGLSFDKH